MNGYKITNLADGTASKDAVNLSQLKAVEAKIGSSTTDPNAVHYDAGTTQGKVTLAGGATGTTITNVKAGDITKANSTDAVNGGQLFATNQNVTNLTNNVNTLNTTVDGLLDDALLWSDDAIAYSAQHDGANARITSVAVGAVSSASTDAINGSQLHGTAQSVADALGGTSVVGTDGKISKPKYKVNQVEQEGVQAAIEALDARFADIGPSPDSLNWDGTAYNAQRAGADQRITGVASAVNANDAVNKGDLDDAVGEFREIAPKLKYIKFGFTTAADAMATGDNSLAIGGFAQASGAGALAIGANARATGTNSVAVGAGSATKEADTFAVGSTATQRRIVNVKAGEQATDAATVGQVALMIDARLGGAGVPEAGMLAPTAVADDAATGDTNTASAAPVPRSKYRTADAGRAPLEVQAGTPASAPVQNAAATVALAAEVSVDDTSVNFRGTTADRTLKGVAAGKADGEAVNAGQLKAAGVMNAAGEVNHVLAYDGAARNSVTLGAPGAGPVAVHNVASGTADTDAVNVAQLNQRLGETRADAVQEANAYTDQRIGDVWSGLDDIANELSRQDRRINDIGAMSTAHAQMVSNAAAASLRGDRGAWAIGMGHQEGRSAISAGYGRSIGEKAQITIGASFSEHDQTIGLGFGRAL